MNAAEIVFWLSIGLLVYTQVGYPLLLGVIVRLSAADAPQVVLTDAELPHVTLVIAAHREQDVIAAKVQNARALDWPADRLQVMNPGCLND